MKRIRVLLLLIFITTLFIGVGYATVNNVSLTISGNALVANNGSIGIVNVVQSEISNNMTSSETHTATNVEISASFTLQKNNESDLEAHYVIYDITISNDSIIPYAIGSEVFNPTINTAAPTGESLSYSYEPIGITAGEVIPAKTSKTFSIKLTLDPSGGLGNYSVGVNTEVSVEENIDQGVLLGTLTGTTTGDLTGSNLIVPFTANLLNSHQTSKTFNFATNNPNFTITNAAGNAYPNQTIAAETESQNFTFYIKRNANVEFPNSPQSINVFLVPTDEPRLSLGVVALEVDVNQNLTDNIDPVIDSLTITKGNSTKTLKVDWEAHDNVAIDHYDLYLYRSGSNNPVQSQTNITSTTLTHTFNNMSNGTYYVKLIAYDSKNNVEQSTTATAYSWTYTYTITCNNCTANPNSGEIEAGNTLTSTFSAGNGYNPPEAMSSVRMKDSTTDEWLTDVTYTYTNNRLTIQNVTGNIEVSASGESTCLIKGTKILLANGKTKNIEDIRYDDLLAVWNYNTGTLTYTYPLWIENPMETNKYIRITFDDGTYLNIAGDHALYDTDLNLFTDYHEGNINYKVGSNIAKINDDGTFTSVKIKSIETINKKTTYYFVGSTTYYNVIANNILTTDHNTMISNLYGFNDNATWPKEKEMLLNNNSTNLVTYELFKDVLPHYMFKGFRVEEAGFLFNNNMTDLEVFKQYIKTFVLKSDVLMPPINKNNKNYWMVTTNLDYVTEYNKNTYLKEEGSLYTLPIGIDIKSWYSTSDNKYYKPGTIVTVNHGMHFIAIK